jgi:structural maintenance of chromosome 4
MIYISSVILFFRACMKQTLSSLALVFALHVFKVCIQYSHESSVKPYVQPTPLYFMDEIDAALDFRNVSIVANYIKDRTKNAQFIIISLRYVTISFLTTVDIDPSRDRNDMFELSHRLIGIYKTANATQSKHAPYSLNG